MTNPVFNFSTVTEGYTVSYGSGSISTQLPGGPSYFREDFAGAPHTVNVTWLISAEEMSRFGPFMRSVLLKGLAFTIPLRIDEAVPTDYTARMAPRSLSSPRLIGSSTVFTASLEVQADLSYAATDAAVVSLSDVYGADLGAVLAGLAELVNDSFHEVV
jgi:hypothetical protein